MKSPFASKALWYNAVCLILIAVQATEGASWFDPSIQAAIIAVGNGLLRLFTDKGVSLRVKPGKKALLLSLAGCLALGAAGCAAAPGGQTTIDPAQHDAALAYLQSSLDNVQASAEAAKLAHPENAAAIDAQVAPVISQLKAAVSSYKASLGTARASSTSEAWATARAVLSTAVSVVGPVAINALVAR